MMTIGEEKAVAQLRHASDQVKESASSFKKSVEILIKLEAMKTKNLESPGTYKEQDFLDLLEK